MSRDNSTYGFSRPDAEALISKIKTTQRFFPEHKPRSGGGGSGREITFEINSVSDSTGSGQYGDMKSASVNILSASCGLYSLVGTTVTVYDLLGCNFGTNDSDNSEYVGRKGTAEWRVTETQAAGESGATDCYWECTGLCC